jgi:hypothetical protein
MALLFDGVVGEAFPPDRKAGLGGVAVSRALAVRKTVSMRVTALTAIGEIAPLPRLRVLAAMSANSKNLRRAYTTSTTPGSPVRGDGRRISEPA